MTGTVATRISAQPFFAALTDSRRGALAEDGTAVTFAAGERLFDEGGAADMFWLIEQGSVALEMRIPGRGDQIVETLGPGTVLGWSWLHRPFRWQFGGGRARRLEHTLRAVGAVTRALHAAPPGSLIGVRGPFGTSWDVASAAGRDVVIVAGGIGLAPLRPVVLTALADRSRYGRIVLLAGARTPGDLLYADELERWRRGGVEVAVTVDRADSGWNGEVGVVTALIEPAGLAPGNSVAFVCGPDIMVRFTADALAARGIPVSRIRVSLERNMRCGAGWCGHCQLGPLLVCRDGPVVSYDRAAALMTVREL